MSSHVDRLLLAHVELHSLRKNMHDAADTLVDTYISGGKILTCGNGGSAADAEHIVGELMKGFLLKRPLLPEQRQVFVAAGCPESLVNLLQRPIPSVSLVSGVALPTAFANDVAAEGVFAQQVLGIGKPGDALIAISTSGNSRNVIAAVHVAKAMGIRVIGMTGNTNNSLSHLADILLAAPSNNTPEIQEMHLLIYHALCAEIEHRIFLDDVIASS